MRYTMEEKLYKIFAIFRKNAYTLTCAESCTGGLIASTITDYEGSSSIFRGSIVTYADTIKEQELGVKEQTITTFGVVSIQTVKEMLDGVLKKFNATYAIAVSGLAGPDSGSVSQPVGTVVIGVKNIFGYEDIRVFFFYGTRKEIKQSAVNSAFEMILVNLQNLS